MQPKGTVILAQEEELQELQEQLGRVLEQNRLAPEALRVQRNKSTVSVFLRSDLICRLNIKGKGFSGLCVNRQFAGLLPAGAAEGKAQGEMLCYEFEEARQLRDWFPALCRICDKRVDGIPRQFDCCDRYLECSDAGHCTNPDRMYAMECGYKKLLKQGRIFYGKNCNVKED